MDTSARKNSHKSRPGVAGSADEGRPVRVSQIVPVGAGYPVSSVPPPPIEILPPTDIANAPALPSIPAAPRLPKGLAPLPDPAMRDMPVFRRPPQLRLLFSRDEPASDQNPLTYRERAFLVREGDTVADAEEALYRELEQIQMSLAGLPMGKFVMLSMFVDAWEWRPTSPPMVVLEWRDWRGAPTVRYPAHEAEAVPAPEPQLSARASAPALDDRLGFVFEALSSLPTMLHAAQALDFIAGVLDSVLPCDASAACLYDIDGDCLRIVAARGHGHERRPGRPVPSSGGLLGAALHMENRVSVFEDPERELGFVQAIDGCDGLVVRNLLVRPISLDGQLLGALHLINRRGTASMFTPADADVVNYVAVQLAQCLAGLRRGTSRRP